MVAPRTREASSMTERRPRGVQQIRTVDDLRRIRFDDGLAAVEVPVELLGAIPFAGETREPGPRLDRVLRAIRKQGYRPLEPIICRIGMKGRWVVVDGGHRITAARKVAREWWSNLFGRKVRNLYFLLYTTPGSWSKPPDPGDPDYHPPAAQTPRADAVPVVSPDASRHTPEAGQTPAQGSPGEGRRGPGSDR
jgi:hypothetical protein